MSKTGDRRIFKSIDLNKSIDEHDLVACRITDQVA